MDICLVENETQTNVTQTAEDVPATISAESKDVKADQTEQANPNLEEQKVKLETEDVDADKDAAMCGKNLRLSYVQMVVDCRNMSVVLF